MGYITTISIYNDGADELEKSPKDLARKLKEACSNRNESYQFGLENGSHANLITAQKTRHADDHVIYIHMGNCVTEFSAYSKETKTELRRNPDFFNKRLKFLEQELKALKELKKDFELREFELS